jgi:KaiC/GvpD/RAD55 family RecA-like ATPase
MSKDEALAASVANHLAVVDENRDLHAQLLASSSELESFRTLSEEQQRRVESLVRELESLKAQYAILRDQTHRDTMNKLTLSEDLIRFVLIVFSFCSYFLYNSKISHYPMVSLLL